MKRSMRANWRRVFAAFFAVFSVVVLSSVAYAFHLMSRLPRAAAPKPVVRYERQAPDVPALLRRAKAHAEKGEVEQAIVAYRRVLFATPSPEAQLGLAEAERVSGRMDAAGAEYERVLALDARNTVALLQLAGLRSGRRETWPQAEAHYRAYLQVKADDAQAQLGLARLLAWQARAPEAVGLYARPAVQRLMTPKDRRDYALALVTAGRYDDAEPLLVALLAPGDVDVAQSLAGIRAARGDWDGALPLYRSVLEARPDDPHVNLAYGQGLHTRGDDAEALGPLLKAARAMPHSAEAALACARSARAVGRADVADRQFERAVDLAPGDAQAAREYADLLMEKRSFARAEGLYRRAWAAGIRDDGVLLGFGWALAANDKPKEAVPLLEQAYARRPTDRLAFELARMHKKLGQNDRALALLAEIERRRRSR